MYLISMSDFLTTYELTRGRFDDLVLKLNADQLNFRQNPNTLTAGEMALHLAGVEIWFASQLLEVELNPEDQKLAKCATEGSVNDNPFPYLVSEITTDFVKESLAKGKLAAEKIFTSPDPGIRTKSLTSALGPVINGEGAMARYAAHPFYHQGQIYMICQSPNFPI